MNFSVSESKLYLHDHEIIYPKIAVPRIKQLTKKRLWA